MGLGQGVHWEILYTFYIAQEIDTKIYIWCTKLYLCPGGVFGLYDGTVDRVLKDIPSTNQVFNHVDIIPQWHVYTDILRVLPQQYCILHIWSYMHMQCLYTWILDVYKEQEEQDDDVMPMSGGSSATYGCHLCVLCWVVPGRLALVL